MKKSKSISQGDIWLVDFNPVRGDEMQKIRPAVVINGNFAVGLNLKIVVPVTNWRNEYSKIWWLVNLESSLHTGLETVSAANCYQMRCVSGEHFIRKLGTCGNIIEEIIATAQNCIEII